VIWDNNLVTNGFNGRALSPPAFPNIRVMDDFQLPAALTLTGIQASVIEDAAWVAPATLLTEVRSDTGGGGPTPGAGGIVGSSQDAFTRFATGASYFGRAEYWYCQQFASGIGLGADTYWVGIRNPGGGGSGTNYWSTSNGGPDGAGSSTGFFSLDAGATFTPEGAGWQHAFELYGVESTKTGACCLVNGDCVEDQTPGECAGLGGEWQGADVTCEQADCQEHTGACCRDGDCTEETRTDCEQGGGCTRNPEWQCDGDVDGNGAVNPVDQGLVQANFGSQDPDDLCQYDIDCNGAINPVDSGLVQSLFGSCNPPRPPCGGGPAGEFLGYDTTCEDNPCALGACCENDVCTGTTRHDDCAGRWFEGEDCDAGFECPLGGCFWDNNIVTNGVNGRALSPPSFPLIRVADDFDFDAGCVVSELDADIIEDATWTPGAQVTVTVRRDQSGAPAPGAGGILAEQTVGTFTRTATGANYFGRADFLYSVTGLNIPIPNTAKHWIELRNPQGGGAGTNYWMTSDGGPDGMSSSTGYFSLDGGTVYTAEGAGWHHAFEINP
jgi:hypothetical protein